MNEVGFVRTQDRVAAQQLERQRLEAAAAAKATDDAAAAEQARKDRLAQLAKEHLAEQRAEEAYQRKLHRGWLLRDQCLIHASTGERALVLQRVAGDPRWTADQRNCLDELGEAYTTTLAELREEEESRDSRGRFRRRA
jgi:hypothetical protein